MHLGKAPDKIILLHDSQLVECSLTLPEVVGDNHLALSIDTVNHVEQVLSLAQGHTRALRQLATRQS